MRSKIGQPMHATLILTSFPFGDIRIGKIWIFIGTPVAKHMQTGFQFDDDVFFHGEQGDLMELMGNLLDNACKFAISEIQVRVNRQGSGLLIVVEDDGPGIDPGKSQQIFQRGVRADSSPGQGIGLAVVTEIVHSYGGKIRVDESPLGGARFHITLP